ATLLWHLSPWELGRLYRDERLGPAEILEPRTYHEVVVVMADLCSYTSFVRDTRDPGHIRRRLTEYYSLARHAILNAGGMLYQFVGDEVVAVFGLHRSPAPAAVQALTCVRSLFAAGTAVSHAWQRVLDEAWRGAFEAIEPVDAKNVGRIQGWRTTRNALESVLAAG